MTRSERKNRKILNEFLMGVFNTLFGKSGIVLFLLAFYLMMLGGIRSNKNVVRAYMSDEELQIKMNMIDPTFKPSPTPFSKEEQKIRKIVLDVFGKDYEKAMYLLLGKKGTCKENYNLDPNATNVNKDGSTDWGLFQINDKWNGITHKGKAKQLLLDPEINVRVAYRIYVDNGFTFKQWSCGRVLGI